MTKLTIQHGICIIVTPCFFKRPPEWIRKKYSLANGFLPEYGGELSHIVVMQHVKKNIIDDFVADLVSLKNK